MADSRLTVLLRIPDGRLAVTIISVVDNDGKSAQLHR